MAAKIIDGKLISSEIKQSLEKRVAALRKRGIIPRLVVIMAGNDPGSDSYVRSKMRFSSEIGVDSEVIRYPEGVNESELLGKIAELNKDPKTHGILVQLPLPEGLSERLIIDSINPKKDVDGFSPENVGNLLIGETRFESCTPKGIMRMLDHEGIAVEGKEVVIINRSNIVGKPLAAMMIKRSGTVTVCHSRTRDIKAHARRADILVVGVGRPNFITADMVKPGSVIIDVGINRTAEGTLCGDVDFGNVKERAGYISPVPGGVGLMTVAILMENTVMAAEQAR
jgi:methylenetetrahydrofolate dehydrogenase (NADP+)/methenyltetrahydrofolate cyclohydrolase